MKGLNRDQYRELLLLSCSKVITCMLSRKNFLLSYYVNEYDLDFIYYILLKSYYIVFLYPLI